MDDDRARVVALIAQQPASPGDDGGVMGGLRRLCAAAVQALSASGAAVSVMSEDGARGVMVASDPASERIEELQFVLGEGPGIDAFAGRRPVLVPDLAPDAMDRWPVYIPATRDLGVQAVFAFPLQVGAARLGVLNIYRAGPGLLTRGEFGHALMFAEVALTSLLDGQHKARSGTAADGLVGAVERRAELFLAQGMVMVQLGVGLAEALTRIRAHAYAQNRRLAEVTADVLARRLRFEPDQRGSQTDQGEAGRQS
ncbi:MAG: GAF and ANTAR domain-containing protein [Natronosporangium sp.]